MILPNMCCFQMENNTMDILQQLAGTPGRPRTVQEWIAQINLCILLALRTATVEQYGLLRYHVRRSAELFKIALTIHNRMLEGATDIVVTLEDMGGESDPPTWMDWFRRVQNDMAGSNLLAVKGGSTAIFEDIIMHLDDVYQHLNSTQSTMEGVISCVQNYVN